MGKKLNVTKGDRYYYLTIIREVEPTFYSNVKQRMVLCKCDCGEVKEYRLSSIRSGNTKSCGCMKGRLSESIPVQEGDTYGMLKVIKEVESIVSESNKRVRKVLCMCECGNQKEVALYDLTSNHTKSCGCLQKARARETNRKYAKETNSHHPLYKTWRGMINRCYNPKDPNYHNYGHRGVKIYSGWLDDFSAFTKWALDNGWSTSCGLSIDRINVNGDYEPSNCRWADYFTQNANRRINSNNKSGVTGVSYERKSGKWKAQMVRRGVKVLDEHFTKIEDAIEARKKCEIKFD